MGFPPPEYDPPGFGFSLDIIVITPFNCSSLIEYLFINFSKCFFENCSNEFSIISIAKSIETELFFLFNCRIRQFCKERAPTPGGSNS